MKDLLFFNMVAAEGNQLVQHGLGIPHPAVRHFRHGERRLTAQGDSLGGGDVQQMVGNDFRRDGTQVETLAAGKNGRQDFVRFRGCEDEFDVLGRLFQRFQKCVEGFLRKHVHLVYINNAEVASAGGKAHIGAAGTI